LRDFLLRWLALLKTAVPAAARSDARFTTAVIGDLLPGTRHHSDPGSPGAGRHSADLGGSR
jgi:hypothetical protein